MTKQINIIENLLKHPEIDINVIDNEGKTAIDHALKRGFTDIIDLLSKFPV